jgi:hypothetical protein
VAYTENIVKFGIFGHSVGKAEISSDLWVLSQLFACGVLLSLLSPCRRGCVEEGRGLCRL